MCGLAGFMGGYDKLLLKRMSHRIKHRGPDDYGSVFIENEGIGLAHRRLSIIDTSSSGHQPMRSSTGDVVIIFNGEIYNFTELRNDLRNKGVSFRGNSDTEVLLNLYIHMGIEFLKSLNGIFAFAIWDSRSRELLVARDGLGVKPFYYSESTKGFLFASEIKSILEEPSVSREINPNALVSHLTYLWSPAPATILGNIKKLEPGAAMIIRNGKISKEWKFYNLPIAEQIPPISISDARNSVRNHVKNAVARQLVADVPIGAFLSGGLDSSAVVAFAKETTGGERLQCFTISIDDKSAKQEGMTADLPYAIRVAEHLGVDLHKVHVGPEMADELITMIYHLDEPQADPAPLNVLLISRLAREHGIKVLLSGAGGDDIFSGYRRHRALMLERYWSWLPLAMRHGMTKVAKRLPNNVVAFRRMAKAFRYADRDGNSRIASYFNWLDADTAKGLLSSDLRAELHWNNPLEQALIEIPENIPDLNRMLLMEQRFFLADHNLNYTDKMGMAAGVEIRVPLLDRDLVNFAAQLPVEYKQRGKEGKWIFKQAMEGILPNDVIYRPKTGFGTPLRAWLHGPLKILVHDILSESSIRRRNWFDYRAVAQLLKADEAGIVDGSYSIFALLCIELWASIFIEEAYR